MMSKLFLKGNLFFAFFSLIFMSCGAAQIDRAPTGGDMPKWVMAQPPLCGVGIQKFLGNLGASKTAAETSARADLSRQLETKIQDMVKSYNAEGGTADGDFSEEETRMATTAASKQTLSGSRPKAAHFSQTDKQYYSLVCLDPGVFSDVFNKMNELNSVKREALRKRAQKAEVELKELMEGYDEM
jgi:hypothetical protein